jgi:hypothetical protein
MVIESIRQYFNGLLEPNDPAIVRTVGATQYRVGASQEAFKTLGRAEKLQADDGDAPDPAGVAFTAMALHQLGRVEEAKSTLGQLRRLLNDERLAGNDEVKALPEEVGGLIAGTGPPQEGTLDTER